MVIMFGNALLGSWGVLHASGAIERNSIVDHSPVNHDRLINIHISHHGSVNPGDRRVIPKDPAVPLAADVANANIPEPIINAAIVAHMGAPVSGVPDIKSPGPTPISGCP